MAQAPVEKESIKRQTVAAMKKLGTYRAEFAPIIEIYAGLREQYARLMEEYDRGSTFAYAVKTRDGGEKRSPLASAVESLRKDILLYSDRLMLNPKAERDSKAAKPATPSKLEAFLHDV